MNSFTVRSAVSRESFVWIYLWSGVRKYVFFVFPIGAAFEIVYAIFENWSLPWSDIIKMKELHSYLLLGSKKGMYYVDGRKLSNDQKVFIASRIKMAKSM